MNWNDYEAVWKRQELPVGSNADIASLVATFEAKSRKLHAVVQASDFAEAGAGLVVATAYAFFWWQAGRTGWPLAFAIALILGVTGFFLRERLRARRTRMGADAPMLEKIDADLRVLRRRCHLVRTMWIWYLGPCAGAMAIQIGLIIHRSPPWDPIREPAVFIGFCTFFALMFWFAWTINHRAVRKRIEPRIEELEKLRREIIDGGAQHFPVGEPAGTSVGVTNYKILFIAVPTVLLAAFIVLKNLSAEHDGLKRLAAENARLKDENVKLAEMVKAMRPAAGLAGATAPSGAAAAPVRPSAAEPTSRQTVPLAGGLTPTEALGNAGRATARNAFATQLWAARTGDVALEASTITFGAEARARLEALATTLPDDMRSEYDTPEKLMAFMLAGSPHPVGGMQVLGEDDVDANDVTLQTEWQHVDDPVIHQSDVNLVQDAGGWKMVVPYSLVNRASNYLSRTIAAPPAANPGK
jgi:hypothetical protein